MGGDRRLLREIGEFGLLRQIRKWMQPSNPSLIRGIGDDVAVFEAGEEALLATTDILIEGIHFLRDGISPYQLAKKALAVNLSDIASMGGTPSYFLLSLGLPADIPFSFVSLFYRGLKTMATPYQVDLIGGDTSLSPKIVINICLLGEGKKRNLIYRNGAREEDDLYVTGTLGDSALGWRLLQGKKLKKSPKHLIQRHLSPTPRVHLGRILGRRGLATAMIDVSDGLLIDLTHILEESRKGARIWEDRIPLSKPYRDHIGLVSEDPFRIALSGGEDYELLFTSPPGKRSRLSELSRQVHIPITRIGKILPLPKGLRIVRKDGKEYFPSHHGFDHFAPNRPTRQA